nr:peptidase C48, SUMO/sentrin/Ubl1 [Tanacetum cinerariifolium]
MGYGRMLCTKQRPVKFTTTDSAAAATTVFREVTTPLYTMHIVGDMKGNGGLLGGGCRLIVPPIFSSGNHRLVVSKPKTMVILDNSDSRYTYASKYKEACDPLKTLSSRVFAMIHMENYFGDAAKNWEFGLCEESDEQLSMLHRLRYKIATKIMLHQFNDVSNKIFDFAFTFETKNTEQVRVSMIVDAIKNMNNRDPPK